MTRGGSEADSAGSAWSVSDARGLYRVDRWGDGYYGVDQRGRAVVHPWGPGGPRADLAELVEALRGSGWEPPLLLRFPDVLGQRIEALGSAFRRAASHYGYRGGYQPVLPVKVNQQRRVVEDALRSGASWQLGLEVGSKPELLLALAVMAERGRSGGPGGESGASRGDEEADEPDSAGEPPVSVVCNGSKDAELVDLALLAERLGLRIVLVVDRYDELSLVRARAAALGIAPTLGVRVQLATPGSGHWNGSTGEGAKFGLSARELVAVVEELREAGLLGRLELLHFHPGSQVPSIRTIRDAVREAARIHVQLRELGAPLSLFDVGGGLGVDYEGRATETASSRNYTLQEYANDVLTGVMDVCDEHGAPHPTVLSESGRALLAHHAVLLVDVVSATSAVGARAPSDGAELLGAPRAGEHRVIRDLHEAWSAVAEPSDASTTAPASTADEELRLQEIHHDAVQFLEEARALFRHGVVGLEARARAEALATATLQRLAELAAAAAEPPPELDGLADRLAERYGVNFSVFQSLPDHWAMGQLFPVMPVHRLDERPTRRAVLVDPTCDSDGAVHRFAHDGAPGERLPLHALDGHPYVLGIFLVGAYQEILGDLHNLFGDTHAVHVRLAAPRDADEDGGARRDEPERADAWRVEDVREGDRVEEVLTYVGFEPDELRSRLARGCLDAARSGSMTAAEADALRRRYDAALAGSTYLRPGGCAAGRGTGSGPPAGEPGESPGHR